MSAPAETPSTAAFVAGTALAAIVAIPFWAWVGASYVVLGAVGRLQQTHAEKD